MFEGGEYQALGIAPASRGFISVGLSAALDSCSDLGCATSFASASGTRWPGSPVVSGPGWMEDVTRTPQGYVAVGLEVTTDDSVLPAFWHSMDGRVWTRSNVEANLQEDSFDDFGEIRLMDGARAVTSARSGLFAVGADGHAAAVWTSTDGRDWRSVPLAENDIGSARLFDVAASDSLVVVVGVDASGSLAIWSTSA